MNLTFADALKALENQLDCKTAIKILRHMAMKDEQWSNKLQSNEKTKIVRLLYLIRTQGWAETTENNWEYFEQDIFPILGISGLWDLK